MQILWEGTVQQVVMTIENAKIRLDIYTLIK